MLSREVPRLPVHSGGGGQARHMVTGQRRACVLGSKARFPHLPRVLPWWLGRTELVVGSLHVVITPYAFPVCLFEVKCTEHRIKHHRVSYSAMFSTFEMLCKHHLS